jgi:hypothetical protein
MEDKTYNILFEGSKYSDTDLSLEISLLKAFENNKINGSFTGVNKSIKQDQNRFMGRGFKFKKIIEEVKICNDINKNFPHLKIIIDKEKKTILVTKK